jgi:CHASE2 domain-containing sensor protein
MKPPRKERRIAPAWQPLLRILSVLYFAVLAGGMVWRIHPRAGIVAGVAVLAILVKIAFKPTYY